MSRTEIVNIVKKITQLSQRDKADLVRILEQALEGGGGDTSKLVSTEPQELTEEQQMQARENIGLGATTIIPGGDITWDGDTTGKTPIEFAGYWYKISDDVISQDDVLAVNGHDELSFFSMAEEGSSGTLVRGEIISGELGCVLLADNYSDTYGHKLNGVYFDEYVRSLTYGDKVQANNPFNSVMYEAQELTDEQKMQARKNQGLYYSEIVPAQTISWDGDTSGRDWVADGQDPPSYKIADVPMDIYKREIQVKMVGQDNPVTILPDEWSTIYNDYLEEGKGWRCSERIYVLDNAVLTSQYYNHGGDMPFTGIFVPEEIESITIPEYEVVHKIDVKYVDAPPCIVVKGEGDINSYGIANLFAYNWEEAKEVFASVSDGSEILYIIDKYVLNSTHNVGEFGELDIDDNGKLYFYHGEENGSQLELYMIAVGNREDGTSMKVLPLIIKFTTSQGAA